MVAISPDAVGAIGAGANVLALGYLIRFRGWTFLVAGLDAVRLLYRLDTYTPASSA